MSDAPTDPHPVSDAATSPQSSATPGWYPTAQGSWAYFDGQAWIAHAPAPTEEQRGASMASAAWWGGILAGFVPALIIYIINDPAKPGSNRFCRYAAGEYLNAAITQALASVALFAILVLGQLVGILLGAQGSAAGVGLGLGTFFLAWVGMLVVGFGFIAVEITAALRVAKGVWWEARWAIPVLKAHRAATP